MKFAVFIWGISTFVYSLLLSLFTFIVGENTYFGEIIIIFFITLLFSIPAFIILFFVIPSVRRMDNSWQQKLLVIIGINTLITLLYALIFSKLIAQVLVLNLDSLLSQMNFFFINWLMLISSSIVGTLLLLKPIVEYFERKRIAYLPTELLTQFFHHSFKNKSIMYSQDQEPVVTRHSNKILIKGLITGGLILLMLIPTVFIFNLINEREKRQAEVVREVSSKWSDAQTLSGPFLLVNYATSKTLDDGKIILEKKPLILLPVNLEVKGDILPENRPRSIYKVLLYKTSLNFKGSFKPDWPANVNLANIDFSTAQLCFGISDFKGIEQELSINMNQHKLLFRPGLPANDLTDEGLSVPVEINLKDLETGIPFEMDLKLKGSEQLHFLPMSTNSSFFLKSPWPNPSFDGNVLPSTREVTDKGFQAHWNFNQANLPFSNVVLAGALKNPNNEGSARLGNKLNLDFGVSMVQPADQYNKTTRSVKYAILIIGLTFAFFFIIELMQKHPLHPVQYVLVGLALVIFYTLLLSISEFILFDWAYLIAATATVSLVTFYAKAHFRKWSTAAILGAALTVLYGFIFVLIQLEDTALLIGSIGLFIVLAIVMFVSRKINWYGGSPTVDTIPAPSNIATMTGDE